MELPVGRGSYVVKAGEGLSEIAERHGFFWRTLWEHPDNDELRGGREKPEVLLPGDRVTIPALRAHVERVATSQRHTFRRSGVPAKVIVNVVDPQGRPLEDKRYEIEIGAERVTGRTAEGGRVEHWVACAERSLRLRVWPDEPNLPWTLLFGQLDPVDTLRGVRDRLRNLGYSCPRGNDPLDAETCSAIARFQASFDLPATGDLDATTKARLVEAHRS
jgi:N-acetylmuramoyl-L-alanine amidase